MTRINKQKEKPLMKPDNKKKEDWKKKKGSKPVSTTSWILSVPFYENLHDK